MYGAESTILAGACLVMSHDARLLGGISLSCMVRSDGFDESAGHNAEDCHKEIAFLSQNCYDSYIIPPCADKSESPISPISPLITEYTM